LRISDEFDIEIISADSRQIYKHLNIGTAKPDSSELSKVKHHLIDIIEPTEKYSAGKFRDACNQIVPEILLRKKIPLIVGGTGFYIDAFFNGLNAPTSDEKYIMQVENEILEIGYENFYKKYLTIDPNSAIRHDKNNQVKTKRAMACFYQTGELYSSFLSEQNANKIFTPAYIYLTQDRQKLYERINLRVLKMYEIGLIDEVKELLANGLNPTAYGFATVGYKETLQYINNEINYMEMINQTQQSTRRYAKRQTTWFNKLERLESERLELENLKLEVENLDKDFNLVDNILKSVLHKI